MTGSVVVADGDEEDRVGALPDDILRRVLSFLPSRQSVRTCVLGRRWRDLWKSVPTVRVCDGETAGFVSSLLRDRVPLNEFEIVSSAINQEPRDAELWLRYAASCHVRVLRCSFRLSLLLPNMTLVCQQLTRLQLSSIILLGRDRTLDFSSCPVLDVLEMHYCQINADRISSQSLTHLSIERCFFPLDVVRTRISCPSLRAFKLFDNLGLTPFLETMPLLVTTYVRLFEEDSEDGYDHCYNGGYYGACDDESCLACQFIDSEGDQCVMLHGLSGAADLTVIGAPQMIICTRDLKWRHMFSKLKTLCLSEWCLAADFSGLVYFLQQSPILEKLTLQLKLIFYQQQPINREDETYKRRKQLLLSKNLKVVEIKHRNSDRRIPQIVKILVSLGVPLSILRDQHNLAWSDCFGLELE